MLFPVALGAGKRLFPEGAGPASLHLTETDPLASADLILRAGRQL